jgi:O-antigen/teichoic acid export membrane protein
MTTDTAPQPSSKTAPDRLRTRILRAGGWATTGFALDKVIAAVQLVVLTRLLTPADFGLMVASAAILLALLTLGEMGIESALVSRREVRDDDLSVAWTLSLLRAAALAACLWAGAGLAADAMRMPELAALLRVHALALLIQGAQSPALALLLRNLDLGRRVRLDLARRVAEAACTIGLAVWLRSVWALLLGQLAGFLVGSLLSYAMAPWRPRWSLHRESLETFWRYGRHFNLMTVLMFGVMSGGELIIGRMLGMTQLGLYQVAQAIPLLIGVRLTAVVHQVSFPAYSLLQKDHAGLVRTFAFQMGLTAACVAPVMVVLALAAPEIVAVLFGPPWAGTVEPFRALCLYAACAGFSGVMAAVHYGVNRPDIQSRVWMVQFAVYAAAIVPAILHGGLTGAAWVLSASYLAGFLVQIGWTAKLLGDTTQVVSPALRQAVAVVALIGVLLIVLWILPGAHLSPGVSTLGWAVGAVLYALYVRYVAYRRLRALWAQAA